MTQYKNTFGYTLLGLLQEESLTDEAKSEIIKPILEEARARLEPLLGLSLDDDKQVIEQLLPLVMPLLMAKHAATSNLN